jgi:mannose-6-phosphate isomerase-like protein (cupin superfamily)
MRTVLKSWGREEVFVESPYCVKKLVYEHEGIASSLHYHERKHETFTILDGLFEVSTRRSLPKGAEILHRRYLSAGEVIEIQPGTQHQVRWLGQSETGVILECSTADDPEDCIRLAPSEIPPIKVRS